MIFRRIGEDLQLQARWQARWQVINPCHKAVVASGFWLIISKRDVANWIRKLELVESCKFSIAFWIASLSEIGQDKMAELKVIIEWKDWAIILIVFVIMQRFDHRYLSLSIYYKQVWEMSLKCSMFNISICNRLRWSIAI